MLSRSKLVAFIPTRDAVRARAFYESTLGLHFVGDDGFAIVMRSGENKVRIVRAPEFTPLPFTLLGWDVADLHGVVEELAAKGVVFQRYGFLQQTASGIWTAPGGAAQVAWFADPDGNLLSLSQHGTAQ